VNDEPLTPAEQRLAALLALLRSDLVRSRPALVGRIMKRVRWQRVLREVLGAVGTFASTVAQGVTMLVGRSPRKGA
jgi:hypothetical protein